MATPKQKRTRPAWMSEEDAAVRERWVLFSSTVMDSRKRRPESLAARVARASEEVDALEDFFLEVGLGFGDEEAAEGGEDDADDEPMVKPTIALPGRVPWCSL